VSDQLREYAREINDPFLLLQEIEHLERVRDDVVEAIGVYQAEIARRYAEAGRLALEKAGKTHGKVSVDLPGGLKLEAQVSQRVDWDQDKLQSIAKTLPDMATINHYFGIKFNVSEKIYKAIPPGDLRAKFDEARTTKLGDLKVTLTRKDAATAAA
jgi:hypothetical protein